MNIFKTVSPQPAIIFGMAICLTLSVRRARQHRNQLVDAIDRMEEMVEITDWLMKVLCDYKFKEIIENYDN